LCGGARIVWWFARFRCEISFRTGYGGLILDVHWDLGKLHVLPGLPGVEIPVKELAWHLGLPFWAVNGVPFQVCPQDVLDAPDRYRDQWARTCQRRPKIDPFTTVEN
jgi:hypothetical protein